MDGEVIKNYLRGMKISVSEVARRLGVLPQTLSSALGSKDIKTGVLEDVAGALGKSPADFYTGDGAVSAVANNSPNATVTSSKDSLGLKVLEKQLDVMDRQVEILDKQLDTKDSQINSLLQVILKK